MKQIISVLVLMLGFSGFLSNAAAEIEIKKQQGTRYVTGGMTEEEILAIAEHEHIPEAAACSLAEYYSQSTEGEAKVRDMIVDDIRRAQQRGDREHVLSLLHVLHHYLRSHPTACPSIHPWSSIF